MKILVIGSGGREHALVWKLARSPHPTQLWCAPGNAGIAQERLASNGAPVECAPIGAEDLLVLLAFAQAQKVDLTVVGPDNPLALGIVDLFQKNGLRIWGVNQKAAQFESSKVFSQQFMEKYGIPTAAAGTFDNVTAAKQFTATLGGRCVVKADGLALGKGVLICANQAEAEKAVDEIMVDKAFGAAGARVVIQEYLDGVEVSLHALCDGRVAKIFPTSQDHKRALDGDLGLNTGGMGTYSPTPFLTDTQLAEAAQKILVPFMHGCQAEGIDYRGLLYPGIMLTAAGPKVLEFNARFGDPETQVYLTRLENDLVELLTARAEGHYKHKKQSGGRGQYGEAYLRIAPRERGAGFEYVDAVVGGAIPRNFIPAVEKGCLEALQNGTVAGFQVVDVQAEVYDGSYHDVDSNELSFKISGLHAFKDAMTKARPVLLEPIMNVNVFVPDQYMGDITGDLNHRRGRIVTVDMVDGLQCIKAQVPQAELFQYVTELRSMTGGRASFEMEYSHYEQVPAHITTKVAAEAQAAKKADQA